MQLFDLPKYRWDVIKPLICHPLLCYDILKAGTDLFICLWSTILTYSTVEIKLKYVCAYPSSISSVAGGNESKRPFLDEATQIRKGDFSRVHARTLGLGSREGGGQGRRAPGCEGKGSEHPERQSGKVKEWEIKMFTSVVGGRERKREGPWEHYILIKEWLIIFLRTIFQAPRLMTKHGQHPTSIIRFPPRGERINNAPPASRCRVPRLRPPRPRAAGHFHTARASLQPTNLSPLAQLGSCCYTGAVLLTSSSPSRRLRLSQEAARRRAGKALPFVV